MCSTSSIFGSCPISVVIRLGPLGHVNVTVYWFMHCTSMLALIVPVHVRDIFVVMIKPYQSYCDLDCVCVEMFLFHFIFF